MIARLAVLAALVVAAAGCGGDDPAPSDTRRRRPRRRRRTRRIAAEESTPAPPGSGANAFIGSIAVDPKDGTLMLGTGLGLFRVAKGADARRARGRRAAPARRLRPVSSNLVVRYARPGRAARAPGTPRATGALPENLGLIAVARRRHDVRARRPSSVEADFHILQAAGDRLVVVGAEETDIRVSADGGGTFETRTPPDTPLDVAFDAKDPDRMVVATAQGTFSSVRRGRVVASARRRSRPSSSRGPRPTRCTEPTPAG